MPKMSWKNSRNRVVEPNTYHVVVNSWKDYVSANKNDCVIFEYEIIGPEGNEEIGATLSDFFPLTEKAQWRLATFVNTCGVQVAEQPDMDTSSEVFKRILSACEGRKLWITVSKGPKPDGAMGNKVVDYLPDDDQEPADVVDEVPPFLRNKAERK